MMAAGTGKHKLLSTGPTEPWSIREKLCLASSVMRSGDQNWVSVSRAIKPFAEPGRPPDWFSQKHCASQYSELLETTETPKRKRGEKGEVVETVEDVIVRKLTAERIDELKKLIKETQEKYRKVKREAELIQAGHVDSKLQETWNDIAAKKKHEEEEAEMKRRATESAFQARQAAKNAPKRLMSLPIRSPLESSSPGIDYSTADTPQASEENHNSLVSMNIGSTPTIPVISTPETPGPAVTSTNLETPLTPVLEDSPQKKLLGQKATPPPSPLLSELLKKGSLLPTSPRLVSEAELQVNSSHIASPNVHVEMGTGVSTLHVPELQSSVPVSPAPAGAPTLSRLLEAGLSHFTPPFVPFSTISSEAPPPVKPLQNLADQVCSAGTTTMTQESSGTVEEATICVQVESCEEQPSLSVSGDLAGFSVLIDSGESKCLPVGALQIARPRENIADQHRTKQLENAKDTGVSDYADVLHLGNPADILAMIEEKVEETTELMDLPADDVGEQLAATEGNAASLFQAEQMIKEEAEEIQQQTHKSERRSSDEIQMLAGLGTEEKLIIKAIKQELPEKVKEEQEQENESNSGHVQQVGTAGNTTHSPDSGLKTEVEGINFINELNEIEVWLSQKTLGVEHSLPRSTMRSKSTSEEPTHSLVWSTARSKSTSEEIGQLSPRSTTQNKSSSQEVGQTEIIESTKEETGVIAKGQIKLQEMLVPKEEDGASEAASMDEAREEEPNEVYMSETDNEPPISESDDGFSVHNAHLQSSVLADSIPSSPASSQFSVCSEDQEAIQAQKIWKKAIMLVWRAAANHRYANVFLQPVTDDIAPGYHSIVHRPMDLSTIKKNIETGLIRTTAEFQRDIMLMFQNAVMYNSSDHDVYHMALEMQRDVLEQIQQFLATQLIMQTSESGISAKSLRGRESTRKQDAAEKDSVPMGSPAFLLSLFAVEVEAEITGDEEQESEIRQQDIQQQTLQMEPKCKEEREELDGSAAEDEMSNDVKNVLPEKGEAEAVQLELANSGQEEEAECTKHCAKAEHSSEQVEAKKKDSEQKYLAECLDSGGSYLTLYTRTEPLVEVQHGIMENEQLELSRVEYNTMRESLLEEVTTSEEEFCDVDLSEFGIELSVSESDVSFSSQQFLVLDESAASSHTSSQLSTSTDQDQISAQRNWKRTVLLMWKEIASHRFASLFLNPVTEERVPGYHSRVRRPMDLSNIKRNIRKGLIHTTAEFQRDIMLMFQNAVMYNSSDHDVYHKTVEMQRDVLEQIQDILEAVELGDFNKTLSG
ncbi:bromodomain-containing protein 8 isoform X1 [Carcharodon carcharias]|uniref:bromodomain-containing protein 8 isoform X1 n=1 Tax=Carcharodon carcharias TaxID=13397 RepID=UPI001B7EE523|nr:bromodomain-containing protein 8 isoform X1 [Carcharodon carcharias]